MFILFQRSPRSQRMKTSGTRSMTMSTVNKNSSEQTLCDLSERAVLYILDSKRWCKRKREILWIELRRSIICPSWFRLLVLHQMKLQYSTLLFRIKTRRNVLRRDFSGHLLPDIWTFDGLLHNPRTISVLKACFEASSQGIK